MFKMLRVLNMVMLNESDNIICFNHFSTFDTHRLIEIAEIMNG